MRRIRAVTGPIVLATLFAFAPRPVVGQMCQGKHCVVFECDACRPGTEMGSDQLGEFLAKNLTVAFGTDMRPLSVKLRLELISREEGAIRKYESEAVEVEPGKTYSGATFLGANNRVQDAFAPGFGDRRKITFGRMAIGGSILSDCGDTTHALLLTVVSEDEGFAKGYPEALVCLNVEG